MTNRLLMNILGLWLLLGLVMAPYPTSLLKAQTSQALPKFGGSSSSPPQFISEKAPPHFIGLFEDGQGGYVTGIKFSLADSWKTYWRSPGDAGIPLHVDLTANSLNIKDTLIEWPYPKRYDILGFSSYGYSGDFIIPVRFTLNHQGEGFTLATKLSYLLCSEVCLPITKEISRHFETITTLPDVEQAALREALDQVPRSLSALNQGDEVRLLAVSFQSTTRPNKEGQPAPFVELWLDAWSAQDWNPMAEIIVEYSDDGPWSIATSQPLPSQAHDKQYRRFIVSKLAEDISALEPNLQWKNDLSHPMIFTIGTGSSAIAPLSHSYQLALPLNALPQPQMTIASKTPTAPPPPMVAQGLWGWLWLALIALGGGAILNIMPCVLPVLSLKLLGLVKNPHDKAPLLMTALGIEISFLGLGAVIIGVKAVSGQVFHWGQQFQNPYFLVTMLVLIGIFAVNLAGGFEITLPRFIGNWGGRPAAPQAPSRASRWLEAFLSGVLATLLATPCSAPLVGTAVGFAFAGDSLQTLTLFALMGLGMALPYFLWLGLGTLFPHQLAKLIPKPGTWLGWVKPLLSLPLVGTMLWIGWVLSNHWNKEALVSLFILIAAGGFILLLRPFQPQPMIIWQRRAAFLLLFLPLPLSLWRADMWQQSPASGQVVAVQSQLATQGDKLHFQAFDPLLIPKLQAEGKRVLVDITADWCLTCQWNSRVLADKALRPLLTAPDIVLMQGDWTLPNQAISEWLASFHRQAIPFAVLYFPTAQPTSQAKVTIGQPPLILPELLQVKALETLLTTPQTQPQTQAQIQLKPIS